MILHVTNSTLHCVWACQKIANQTDCMTNWNQLTVTSAATDSDRCACVHLGWRVCVCACVRSHVSARCSRQKGSKRADVIVAVSAREIAPAARSLVAADQTGASGNKEARNWAGYKTCSLITFVLDTRAVLTAEAPDSMEHQTTWSTRQHGAPDNMEHQIAWSTR